MDTYENDNLDQEFPDTQPQSGVYSGAGAGRKESPFADSPYVMEHQPDSDQSASQEPKISPKKPKKSSGRFWKGAVAAVLALVLVIGSCAVTAALVNDHWEDKTAQLSMTLNNKINDLQAQLDANTDAIADVNASVGNTSGGTVTSITSGSLTPSQVYSRNVKSVVLIYSEVVSYNSYGQATSGASTGSGFILSEDGYVVTNYHVVEGATTTEVVTYDNTEYAAKLIGYDSTNDIALLKVEAQDLPAVTIGSSDDLIVGDQVVAIGNPLGELTSTMTVGYVSAKDRDVITDGTVINMIQTDAAINSGNSGGPLFNMKGEVVGITTAKYSGSTSSGATIEGIGFAIPIDDVIGMISDLKEYGYVTGAYLGVMVRTVDTDTASMYGLPQGSYVDSVTEGSCADVAGIRAKDIIIGLGDTEITGNTSLTRALRQYKAGDTTTITVYRAGRELELTITFDEKPHDTAQDSGSTQPSQGQMPSNGSYEEWYNFFAPFFGSGNGNG